MAQEKYGNYILLELLAAGGMAEVFLAKKMGLNGVEKFVAIKRILPQYSQNEQFIEMFKHEALVAINLSHTNIVSVFDFGLEKKQFYIVMDYVFGKNVKQILTQIAKSKAELKMEYAVYIVREIAAGLDYAHRARDNKTGKPLNIIHRDVSPQNVMISYEGEVRIVDFGIAKAESQAETTQVGTLKGKFAYMSPEQVEHQQLDLRTDIFSLGILLWELLANERLFVASTEGPIIKKIKECRVPMLKGKDSLPFPQELQRIVSKALMSHRDLRYQTAAALQKDLTFFLNKFFPMFSSQEFSDFMKSQFSADIISDRKDRMGFSNMNHDRQEAQYEADLDLTVKTDASGPSPYKSHIENPNSTSDVAELPQESNPDATGVDEVGNEKSSTHLSMQSMVSSNKTVTTAAGTSTQITNFQFTNSEIHNSRNPFMYPVIALAVIFVSLFVYSKVQNNLLAKHFPGFAACISNPMSSCNKNAAANAINVASASSNLPANAAPGSEQFQNERYRIHINSNQSTARICVGEPPNQKCDKTTPDFVEIEAKKPTKIMVKMDGFEDWEKIVSVESSESYTAELVRKRTAYLIVNLKGAGNIYVNREKVARCSISSPCSLKAGFDNLIEAYGADGQSYDKLNLTMNDGETKSVVMEPKPGSTPAKN